MNAVRPLIINDSLHYESSASRNESDRRYSPPYQIGCALCPNTAGIDVPLPVALRSTERESPRPLASAAAAAASSDSQLPASLP